MRRACEALSGQAGARGGFAPGLQAEGGIVGQADDPRYLQGGIMWGIASALFEAGHIDPRFGHMVNCDLGELGACGSGAAVTNAIYHVTGLRVREFPITPARLLQAAEAAERR